MHVDDTEFIIIIILFKKTIQTVELCGYVWPSNMYIQGGINTESPIVSLEAQPSPSPGIVTYM